MKSYEIILKDANKRYYKILYWFIVVINFIAFVVTSIYFHESFGRMGAILLLTNLVLSGYMKTPVPYFNERITLFQIAILWAVGGFWASSMFFYPALIHFAIAFFFYLSSREKSVTVSADGIRLPTLIRSRLAWSDLSNVVLKDHLLTIDQRNNKLLQQAVDDASFTVDEREFNEFCSQQLAK